MKTMTEINPEDEIYIEESEWNQEEGELTSSPTLLVTRESGTVMWESTELRKAKMRWSLEDRVQDSWYMWWVSDFLALKYLSIIEDALAEWDSRWRDTAIKWLKEISELMWYKESNQTTTIRSKQTYNNT